MAKNGNLSKDNMPYSLVPEEQTQEKSPGFFKEAGRHIARTGARIGEQIAGAPGDIFSLINSTVAGPLSEKITGNKAVPYEETLLGKVLPTTEEHRKRTTAALGKTVEPQNKVERFIDDVFTDATSLLLPGAKAGKLAKSAAFSLGKSIGANVVGKTVEDVTNDKEKAAYSKLGSLFLLSLVDQKRAAKAVGELYGPLQAKAAQLKPVDASQLENTLQNLRTNVSKGTLAPSEKFVYDEANLVLQKIKNGKISPEEAWAAKRSLNEKLPKALFEIPGHQHQQRARSLALKITNALDNALAQTQHQDPKFYKDLKSANRAFATIADSNFITKSIEKNLRYTPITTGLLHAMGGPISQTAIGAAVPYAAGKILYRIAKSPALAKHYTKTLVAAGAQDAIVFNRELKKLDKMLQKEEKQDTFSLVD